ncbi:zinc finger protein ZFP2-like isoform X2 [Corythoichthys intestinalis]|uniref:zinc finger protein ZFP2-like isoform X2 n=1 Tax=Corythoichthys intestinalis TaxID=161448 RepID=UPI0025A68EE1|nr:zinc finger protein ZFP2-like isoform X2 [Corythoichthys intestinalis]
MPYIKQEEEPETPSIKEEKQEDEIPKFPMTVSVKSEENEDPIEEIGAAKPTSDSSFQHLPTKGDGRSQPDDVKVEALHPEKHDPPHVKQESIKQEAEPDNPSFKKEKQEEETSKFPMTAGVKSEKDECPSEESRATKRASRSLFQHLTTKVEDLHSEKRDPPHVKQESEMPSIKLEPELNTSGIKQEQEDEILKFPVTVRVKSEEDEGSSEESRATKLASRSLFQHLTTKVEDLHSEKRDPPCVKQESEMPSIKLEPELKTSGIKEEQKDEILKFPVTVRVKSEEDEGPSEESRATKLGSRSLFQRLTTKVEDLHSEKRDPSSVKQKSEMPSIKLEAELKTSSIKEEQEDEILKFPVTVRINSEEATKLASSNLFQQMTTKGEGRSEPVDLLAPLSDSDDMTSHSSDYNTDEEDVDFEQSASKSLKKSSLKRNTKDGAGGKPFSCSHCDKTFTTKEYLFVHTHTHTEGKPFLCTFCGKRFSRKATLKIHTRTHTGEKTFVCSLCNKRFCTKHDLTRHTRTHTGEKPFVCTFCGQRFTHKGHLNVHKRTHTGEKPFVCSLCDKRFCTKQVLATHTRTHTGEKPFLCTFCDERFAQKGPLITHTRTHTGEKPFVCSLCNKRFCTKQVLTTHTRTHTGEKPFRCTICDERFTQKRYLKIHTRTHTGDEPHVCSLCDRRFCTKEGLKKHTRTHTGEKPFVCSLCDKGFYAKEDLTKHAYTHRGKAFCLHILW